MIRHKTYYRKFGNAYQEAIKRKKKCMVGGYQENIGNKRKKLNNIGNIGWTARPGIRNLCISVNLQKNQMHVILIPNYAHFASNIDMKFARLAVANQSIL